MNFIDPIELWIPITKSMTCNSIIEGKYFISNLGNVYSLFINDYMTLTLSHDGYLVVGLRTEDGNQIQYRVNRLVLLGFDYRADHKLLIANHLNGNKLCNKLWNLEWTTFKGNTEHAIRTGLMHLEDISGENNPCASITEDMADYIAYLLSIGISIVDISNQTGVSIRIIHSIKDGKTWIKYYQKYKLNELEYIKSNAVFTDQQVHIICKYFQDNKFTELTKQDIIKLCQLLNLEYSASINKSIRRIFLKERLTRISSQYNF